MSKKAKVNDSLGERLRRHRVENDLTQPEMAERLGVSQSVLSLIENGWMPGERIRFRIERYFERVQRAQGGEK